MLKQFMASHTPVKQFMEFLELSNRRAAFDSTGTVAVSMLFSFIDRLSLIDRMLIRWYMQKYHQKDYWIFPAWREHRRTQCGAS